MSMTNKKRILFDNEFSLLSTGFSTYGNEVIMRLYNTGKYEIAEIASYVSPDDDRIDDVPWKVYPVMPSRNDVNGWNAYNNLRTAQFGELKLTDVLLDFKPDIVASWRDPWMDEHIARNPFRDKFKWIYMATIDGEPQRDDWIELYKKADYMLTYSKWASNLLKSYGIKSYGVHNPGSLQNIFFPPENKRQQKEKMGLNPDWNIVQVIMRNQGRKLYPELFKAFSLFIEKCVNSGNHKLAANTYLHIHCSLEDVGWDIAKEIQKYHISHKVLITYLDHHNKECEFSFYKGKRAWSKSINAQSVTSTNTAVGVTREQLSELVRCADLCIEYSTCEGSGMSKMDAKMSGVPVMAIPYSASAEQVLEPGGIPLKIITFFQETIDQTSQRRALPDNQYTANAIYNFFMMPISDRKKLGDEARKYSLEHYTYDGCAKKWEDLIDNIPIENESSWISAPSIHNPDLSNIPWNLHNKIFVEWAYKFIVGRPWLLHTGLHNEIIRWLESGKKQIIENNQQKTIQYDKKSLIQELIRLCEEINNMEINRYNFVNGIKKEKLQYIKI